MAVDGREKRKKVKPYEHLLSVLFSNARENKFLKRPLNTLICNHILLFSPEGKQSTEVADIICKKTPKTNESV